MSYVVVRRETGVYDVAAVKSKHEAGATCTVVIREGKVKLYEVKDDADRECRAMNKERLKRYREAKKAQGRLFEEGA